MSGWTYVYVSLLRVTLFTIQDNSVIPYNIFIPKTTKTSMNLSVSILLAQLHLEEQDILHKMNRNNISNFWIGKLFQSSLFTFWSFCCKLRVKIKCIFRSASCRFKRGMNFSPVQFLKRRHKPEWIKRLHDTTKQLTKKSAELILN